MTPAEILKEARRLIVEKGWTQGAYARDGEGRKTSMFAPEAACFCMVGAIRAAAPEECAVVLVEAETKLMRALEMGGIVEFNDDSRRTKEEVVAAFDKAIKIAEEGTVQ